MTARRRLLIADDHGLMREVMACFLEGSEFEVVAEAEDGREAVQLAKETQPELVLMDISMPQMNGLEAT
ncbi:MAG: response regulator transcription factor, partial [Chloroflexota bacterium]|nr:response regulator transcription factor [Chloroflexota bacterium]